MIGTACCRQKQETSIGNPYFLADIAIAFSNAQRNPVVFWTAVLNGAIISLLVAIADTTLAKTIFVKLRDHRQELAADPRNAETQAIDAQLRGLFQFLSAPVAVEGLSDVLAEKPDDAELSIITEMFSSMGPQHEGLRDALPDHLRQQLRG